MNRELVKHVTTLKEMPSLGTPKVSFEFFPPKTPQLEHKLWDTVQSLKGFGPEFLSVTYGAGGTTKDGTWRTVKRIKEETSLVPAAHLTCVGATKTDINALAAQYKQAGVNHIVALRGDPPQGAGPYSPHPQGYAHTVDMIRGLKEIGTFDISVACFPEVHPEAESPESDLRYLKEKMDAGAARAITQFFFDVEMFLDFKSRADAIGIKQPIVPGIMLISNFEQLCRFAKMCGASIPDWLHRLLDGLDAHPEQRNITSAAIAAEQCRLLMQNGVKHFHFYTLNRADIATAVCHLLGLHKAA